MVRRDRAQLILVGALIVALLIMGITVIINTVLYVENTPTDEGSVVVDEASTVSAEVGEAVHKSAYRINHQTRNHSWQALQNRVAGNLTRLEASMNRQYLEGRSLSVNISLANQSEGTRVVQAADANFTDPSTDDADWDPVANDSHRIGWFTMNLDGTAQREGRLHVNVTNGAESVNYTIEQTNSSSFVIKSSASTSGSTIDVCSTRERRLVLDFYAGESPSDRSCEFDGITAIDKPAGVSFEGGKNATGKYGIVIGAPVTGLKDFIVAYDTSVGATTTHEVNYNVTTGSPLVGDSLNEIEIDYSDTGSTSNVSDVDQSNVFVGLDTDDDGVADINATGDIDSVSTSSASPPPVTDDVLTISLIGNFDITSDTDRIVVKYDDVDNGPTDNNVDVEVNGGTGSDSGTLSLGPSASDPAFDSAANVDPCSGSVPATDACHAPAVWTMEYETDVVGAEFTQTTSYDIAVYPEGDT